LCGDFDNIAAFFQNFYTRRNVAVVELTKDNFESTITENDFVIIDFWAPWCGPCRSFAPTYEAVAEDNPNIVFAKVNTEEEQELAMHFQVRSIPTLMIFREKIIIFSQPGALPESAFRELLTKAGEVDMNEVRAQIEAEQQGTQDA
jgi:thioredoxin 1